MTRPDQNQIAARILRSTLARFNVATRGLQPHKGVNPKSLLNLEQGKRLSPDRRAALGRQGALARWGSATLGIMPNDSSNVCVNVIAARTLAAASGEKQNLTAP